MPPVSYARHRFPPVVIRHAVRLSARSAPSHRDVEDLPAGRGLDVSHEAVRRRAVEFGPAAARRLRRRRPKPGPRRRLGEMAVSVGGGRA